MAAEQVLDVVDEQLLMLHFVLEAKPDQRFDFVRIREIFDVLQQFFADSNSEW